MPARLSAFAIWALVAAGMVFWFYRLVVSPMAAPSSVQTVGEGAAIRGDLTRLFGAAPVSVAPPPVVQSSRYRLLGVLAPRPASGAASAAHSGVALIAVDGNPARVFVVGAKLDGDLVLQTVSRRSASIGPAQGATSIVLELPPPPPPTTGTLPKAPMGVEPPRSVVPPPQLQPQPTPPVPQTPPQPPQAQDAQAQPADGAASDNEPPGPRFRKGGLLGPASR